MTLWLFRHRLSLSADYCPMWDRPVFFVSENGGRHPHECLDLNAAVWRLHFSVTFWGIGRLAHLLRHIPDGRNGRGHEIRLKRPSEVSQP
jgi:hypothetical protein